MPSLVGELLLTSNGTALTGVHMGPDAIGPEGREDWVEGGCKFLDEARRQLTEYFAGTRQAFKLPLRSGGSEFQQRVWTALQTIPYGTTMSYRDVARLIHEPRAARAVGMANGKNPLCIVVPCHRVIAADGSVSGHGGGRERRVALLKLEKVPL